MAAASALAGIPPADLETFAAYPARIQREVLDWIPIVTTIGSAPATVVAMECAARETGRPFATIRRHYYAWRAQGWEGLVRRNALPARQGSANVRLSAEFVAEWKRRCELVQRRAIRQAHAQLLRDLRDGRPVPGLPPWTTLWAEDHPGTPIPQSMPVGWIPKGLSYPNLIRLAPSRFELATMRQGRFAASSLRPLVRVTRAGLEPGQILVFDDMWHDHKVNFFGAGQQAPLRPLEFHCIDLASTCKIAYGIRPRAVRPDGSHDQLKDAEFRQLLAQVLFVVGYRQEGVALHVEHGTAAISRDLEEYLAAASAGAISVERGGIDAKSILKGGFAPRGRGNFRFKAALESLGGLYHNALAMLPGQTGLSPDRAPENADTLDKYDKAVLAAVLKLPEELALKLWFPVLSFREFGDILAQVYDRLNARTDHDLEGWEESGYVEQAFVPAPGLPGIPLATLYADPARYAGAIALANADPARYVRQQKLSPAAVWAKARPHLVRLPLVHAPRILGPANAFPATVSKSHEIWITFPDTRQRVRFSPELHEFSSPLSRILPAGENIVLYPIAASPVAVVCSTEGTPVGYVAQFSQASHADRPSILRQIGQTEHVRALMERDMRDRHAPDADEIAAMKAHNALLLSGRPHSPRIAPPASAPAIGAARPADLSELIPDPLPPADPFSDSDEADSAAAFLDGITIQ